MPSAALSAMPAAVYTKEGVRLETRPIPEIQEPRDAIVRVTRSTICTSDLHILHGAVPQAKPGVVLGHEFVGEVVETGPGLSVLKPGDRVAANCETFCGECWFCRRGYVNNCEKGGWLLGCRIDGCQAAAGTYRRRPSAHRFSYHPPGTVGTDSPGLSDFWRTAGKLPEMGDHRT